ncbi:hypothetical protein ACS0TY_005904 [Phlomoides rotata]
MSGQGSLYEVLPECQPNLRILRFTANNSWELAQDPLHGDIDVNKSCGVGSGCPSRMRS